MACLIVRRAKIASGELFLVMLHMFAINWIVGVAPIQIDTTVRHSPAPSKMVNVNSYGTPMVIGKPPQVSPLTELRLDMAKFLHRTKVFEGLATSCEDEMEASAIVAENVSLAEFLSIGDMFHTTCPRLELVNGDIIARLSASKEHGFIASAVLIAFGNAGFGGDSLKQSIDSSVFLPDGLGVPQADVSFTPRFRNFPGNLNGDRRILPTVVVEGNTAGSAQLTKLRSKMERYLHPESPVVFFIGIAIVGVPVTDDDRNFFWLLTGQRDRWELAANGLSHRVKGDRVWDHNVGPGTNLFHDNLLGVMRFPYELVYEGVADWEADGPLPDAYEVNIRRLVSRVFYDVFDRIITPLAF